MKQMLMVAALGAAFVAGYAARGMGSLEPVAHAQAAGRVFELRTYTAPEGKLEALHARFKDHTLQIFERHHMTNIGYFRPMDSPASQNQLVYVLAHPSREDAKKNWAEFQADPEWKQVSAESEKDGRLVTKVESVFLEPADYSPLK